MASTMFATEVSGSAFLGAAMPKSAAISGKARVSMGFSRQDLEKKPLALLRALARQRGIPISTRPAIINGLLSSPSYKAPTTSYSASSPASDEYSSKTLGELRALAKARGLRGDTRAEIIQLLKSGPAVAAPVAVSTPAVAAASAAPGLPKAVLDRKSLAELRAMARVRGLRGDTKAELVKLLSAEAPAAPASSNGAAYTFNNYPPPAAVSSNGASSAAVANSQAVRLLSTKSLSQLRAMANVRGIRGTTKDELVKQLAAVA